SLRLALHDALPISRPSNGGEGPLPTGGRGRRARVGGYAGSRRTAHTLNSGIRLTGSSAGLVTRLAACSAPKWNGRNTVSGRRLGTHRTRACAVPRRETTRAQSPSARPARAAVSGWASTNASGTIPASSATRRVFAPDL